MSGFEEEAKQWEYRESNNPQARPDQSERASKTTQDTSPESQSYQDFVHSLIVRLGDRLGDSLNKDVQDELANLLVVLAEMPPKEAEKSRFLFEFAFDQLSAKEPNIGLVRVVRQQLSNQSERSSSGLLRIISFLCGRTQLNAAISALISVILFSILIIWLMLSTHEALLRNVESTSVLMSMLSDGSVELLSISIHAAFVGGVVSIVARIQDFTKGNAVSPVLVFISVFRKPFLAAAFSVLVFSALKTGLVSFPGLDFSGSTAPFFAWAIGFLCGFGERFAQDYVVSVEGRFS